MSYVQVQLSDVCDQIRGVSYKGSEAADEPRAGYVPVLRANNITDDGLFLNDLVYVPQSRVSKQQMLKVGDVVIAASSGSLSVVGKAAPVTHPIKAAFGAFCKVLRPNDRVFHRYFFQYFRTAYYRRKVSSLAAGANINNLRNEHLNTLDFPLPEDIEEQKRIAAILDKADDIRRKRRQSLALTNDFLRSVFLDMFGDPVTNPKGWPQKQLGQIISLRSGQFLPASAMDTDGSYPVYGGNGVNGYHSEYMFDRPMIVIGRVGAYCGAIHHTKAPCWVTDNALYVQQQSADVIDGYLLAALEHAALNQYAGRAGQPLLSGSRIYPVPVLVPSISQQKKYLAVCDRLNGINHTISNGLEQAQALSQGLAQQAFRGDL